jgi:hypothetical protein
VVFVGPVLVGPSQAGPATAAPNSNTFSLSAEADGVNVEVRVPGGALPVVQSVAASPWGASASLDSLGQSNAAAGTPYSPFLYSLPGTINGLASGQVPPLPPLPGEVSSSYPTSPTASQTNGPYSISAKSTPEESSGTVANGASPPGSSNTTVFANARATAKSDGTVVASAVAGVDAFDLGATANVGNVSSAATITKAASQPPAVSGRTNLGTLTLAGTTAGLVDHNLLLGGTSAPIPLSTSVLPPLNAALEPAGISLAYIPQTFVYTDGKSSTGDAPDPAKTVQAVDSGALQVTVIRTIPGQGTATIKYTLGRVFVSATNAVGETESAGARTGPSSPDSGAFAPTGTPAAQSTPATPDNIAATPTLASGTRANRAPVATGRTRPVFRRAVTSSVAEDFYLILVVGGMAALGSSLLVRQLGIRLRLAS